MGPTDGDDPDPLHVELSVQIVQTDGRQYPVFHVLVENRSDSTLRIIDLQNRPDLQHGYCPIDVNPVDRSFEFWVSISDPGYLGEEAMIVLRPEENARFELSRQPIDYGQFAPGKYDAVLRCRIDVDQFEKVYQPEAVIFSLG